MGPSKTTESDDGDNPSWMSLPDDSERRAYLINRQRIVQADWDGISAFLGQLASRLAESPFSVCLLSDRGIRRYNKRFRFHNQATDVLAFPAENSAGDRSGYLGDILISVETAQANATRYGLKLEEEIKILALHGLLHLMGRDHENDNGEMAREERRWCARLGLQRGLTSRAANVPPTNLAIKPNPVRDEPGSQAHSDALGRRKGAAVSSTRSTTKSGKRVAFAARQR